MLNQVAASPNADYLQALETKWQKEGFTIKSLPA
jgi:hypothetical protein